MFYYRIELHVGAPSSGFKTPNLPTGDPETRYVIYTGQ